MMEYTFYNVTGYIKLKKENPVIELAEHMSQPEAYN